MKRNVATMTLPCGSIYEQGEPCEPFTTAPNSLRLLGPSTSEMKHTFLTIKN